MSKEKQLKGAGGTPVPNAPARAHRGWLTDPFEDLDQVFDRILESRWLPVPGRGRALADRLGSAALRVPHIDVIEKDGEILVRAETPGVDKDDLDVSVTENSVTIRGEKRSEEKHEDGDYVRSEIVQGAFARTVALPAEVDSDAVEATFRNGVLELKLRKRQQAQRRKIRITDG
jgi:HSP20 family protein